MKRVLFLLLLLSTIANAQNGIISVMAGNGVSTATGSGDGGLAKYAALVGAYNMCFDPAGNMYIATETVVRKVDASGVISTFAGTGMVGFSGDGGPAAAAQIYYPISIAADNKGNVFIADYGNNRIRKVNSSGIISTIAGTNTAGYAGDGGPATLAEFNYIADVATDKNGNVYIADELNSRIRKIDTNGNISTVAGNGNNGFSGDGGLAVNATFYHPTGIAIDDTGNLYIADGNNNRVRKVNTSGIVTTIAGSGILAGFSGDGGPADSAVLSTPRDVAIDRAGNIYIVDQNNYRIRKINTLGIISTVAGTGTRGYTGDGGFAVNAQLSSPYGVITDTSGNVFYADNAGRVRKITFSYTIGASPSDSVCTGTNIVYTANTTVGCVTPTYTWRKNGITVGTNSNTFTSSSANGDSVSCILTCAGTTVTISPVIVSIVKPLNPLSISISSLLGDTICSSTQVANTYSAVTTGTGLIYKWMKSGSSVGMNASVYVDTPTNNENITCNISSSDVCSTPTSVNSNSVRMIVDTIVTTSITISAMPGDEVCAGTQVTFTANATGGGGGGTIVLPYKWFVNGTNSGGGGLKNFSYRPANGDNIRCVYNTGGVCVSNPNTSSNTISMIVDPTITPSISISGPSTAAVGSSVTFTAVVGNAGPSYKIEWMKNLAIFATTTIPTVTFTKGGSVELISAEIVPTSSGCYDSTRSNRIELDVNVGVSSISRSELNLYPNPVNEALHIDNVAAETSYSLQNIAGAAIKQGVLHTGSNEIPMQNIVPGIYLLRISGEPGMIRKVLKE